MLRSTRDQRQSTRNEISLLDRRVRHNDTSRHVMTRGGSGITRHFRFTSGLDVKPPRHVTTSKIGGTPTSSRDLIESASLSNHEVLEEGDNLSDHFPITMSLKTKFRQSVYTPTQTVFKRQPKWAKLRESHKNTFSQRLHNDLASQPSHAPLFCRNMCRCRDDQCQLAIQKEYDFLIASLKSADSALPRYKPGIEKDWWTDDLSQQR